MPITNTGVKQISFCWKTCDELTTQITIVYNVGILQHRCHLLCCSCAMHFGVLLASPAGLVVFLGVFPSLCVLSLVLVCGHCGVWIVVLVKACCV